MSEEQQGRPEMVDAVAETVAAHVDAALKAPAVEPVKPRGKPGPKKGWNQEKKKREEEAAKAAESTKTFVDLGEVQLVEVRPTATAARPADMLEPMDVRARMDDFTSVRVVTSSNRTQFLASRDLEGKNGVLLQPGTRAQIPTGLGAADLPYGSSAYRFEPSAELLMEKGLYSSSQVIVNSDDQVCIVVMNLTDVRVPVNNGELLGSLMEI